MELRSRKLPSPFQPVREDPEDHVRITPPRSFSPDVHRHQPDPDELAFGTYGQPAISGTSQPTHRRPDLDPEDCYIPPSGTPAKDGDHDPARCQPDPDLEDIYFPSGGTSATSGNREPSQRQIDEDLDDYSFRPFGMPAIDGVNDQSRIKPNPDAYLPGRTTAASRANQHYGRPPTPVPRHQSRDMSPVLEDSEKLDPSYSIMPVYQPMTVRQDAAISLKPFQPTHQDPPASCMPGPSPFSFTQRASRPNVRFPRSHRVEPNYENPARHWGSNANRPLPRRPASPIRGDPNILCPWRDSPRRQDTWTPDFARDRFQRQPFNRQARFDDHRRHTFRQTNGFSADRYYDRYSQDSPRYYDEPRPSFPTFNGKMGDWDAFWLKFQLLSERYSWTGRKLVDQLLLSLKDDALTFAASLNIGIRQDATQLIRALKGRFSLNDPAETHQANLNHIRKSSRENLQEYASRVQAMMSKAYPDIGNTPTYEKLLLQHFLNGLPDQNLAYEVMVRQPRTLNEAVSYVRWHECCKESTRKRSNLRHLRPDPDMETDYYDETSDEDEPGVRRMNNRKFVTEERLQQFARDLKKNLPTARPGRESPDRPNQHSARESKTIKCYHCGEAGHISPKCPLKRNTSEKHLSENFRGLDLMAKHQPKF